MNEHSRPWSGAEIDQKLQKAIELLDDATDDYMQVCDDFARAKHSAEQARAKLLLRAKAEKHEELRTDALRGAWVEVEAGPQLFEYRLADGRKDAHRALLSSLNAQIDVLRSLLKSAREAQEVR